MNESPREVLLAILSGVIVDGRHEDGPQMLTNGLLTGGSDEYELRYQERFTDDDEEHTVTLSLASDVISMRRSGDYETNMVFQKGRRYETTYRTPFGDMAMSLFCTRAHWRIRPDGDGLISLQYQLDLGGAYASMNVMSIRMTARHAPA